MSTENRLLSQLGTINWLQYSILTIERVKLMKIKIKVNSSVIVNISFFFFCSSDVWWLHVMIIEIILMEVKNFTMYFFPRRDDVSCK